MNKKGQEEIVGFVAVVVLVAVVLLIVLALVVRRQSSQDIGNSRQVSEFLDAAFKYTTDCEIHSQYSYSELGELFTECHRMSRCLDSSNSCDVLKGLLKKLINATWTFGEDRPIKGYLLNASYVRNDSSSTSLDSQVLLFGEGNCSLNYEGAEQSISDDPGKIYVYLKLCS